MTAFYDITPGDVTDELAEYRREIDHLASIDAVDDEFDAEYCVGNSHPWIIRDINPLTAECACGKTLHLVGEVWTHDIERPRSYAMCPPYDCRCGRRHNERRA